MHQSSTKSEKSHLSVQSSDTKSHINENVSKSTSHNKEILINKGHIIEIENLIVDMKEGLGNLNKKMFFIEECNSKLNSKTAKTAIRSEQQSSKTKNQKSILNLGFIKTYKVTDKSLNSKRKDSETEIVKEKLNLNSKLYDVDMNEPIDEIEEENKSNIDNQQEREQTIVIPIKISESSDWSNNRENVENDEDNKKKESSDADINEIKYSTINKNVDAYDVNLPVAKPNLSNLAFNHDTINKAKQKNDFEDKSINYNQKFFDYMTLHKEKEKETINLKTKHDSSDYIGNCKRTKNDWIRKESDGAKKLEKNIEKSENIESRNFLNNQYMQEEFKKIVGRNIKHDNGDYKNTSPTIRFDNTFDYMNINKDESDLQKLIEMNHGPSSANKPIKRIAMDSRYNSEKKIESPQLSLAFDSNINSKEKIMLSNNFVNIPRDEGKKSTRFSDFLKLKNEDNIDIAKIKDGFQQKPDKRNSYELDLCTLEDTFDEFYDLKPKINVNRTKKNPFIPNNYKANSESNVNLKTNAFLTNRNGVIRNKKEREKMNGYKCEICEREKAVMQFVRHAPDTEKMTTLTEHLKAFMKRRFD